MFYTMPPFRWWNYKNSEWDGSHLTEKEADVLFVLSVHSNRFVHRDDILAFLYPDPDSEPLWALTCLRRFISSIRGKFGKDTIVSNGNYGYRINLDKYDARKRTKVNNFLQTDGFVS